VDQVARAADRVLEGFAHEVVFYDGAADRARALLPFIREGVDLREPVLVALPPTAIHALRDELGADAHRVQFVDIVEVGANPARIIPAWRAFVARHADAGPMRGIGEPAWAGRRDEEMAEAHLHEALLNVVFDDGPAWRLLCPYDISRLPGWAIEEARRTHPVVHDRGSVSARYAGHEHAVAAFEARLPDPPEWAQRFPFAIGELGALRDRVHDVAIASGLPRATAEDLVLAAHELATNSVLHADGGGVLHLWRAPGALVVQVEDAGHIDDPLVGRAEPDHHAMGGRGIWMVNQLCDLVQVRSNGWGTQVRIYAWTD
jgi:anti-sigma regulatory factor (Ser/Thr protein kinase)